MSADILYEDEMKSLKYLFLDIILTYIIRAWIPIYNSSRDLKKLGTDLIEDLFHI